MKQNSIKYFISNPPLSDYIIIKGKVRTFARGTCQELMNTICKKLAKKTIKDIEHPDDSTYIVKI